MRELQNAIEQASLRPEIREAVAAVYRGLQQEIDRHRPRCDLSGRCCRFEEFGHRLFVTTMELATFLHDLRCSPPARVERCDGAGCPFQHGKLCGVHAIRPFGCRIFFCDPASTAWQHAAYERFHADLKRLHESLAVPYVYVEWREALRLIEPLSLGECTSCPSPSGRGLG